ncbi:MAG: penicillin-binding protein 1C [Deltaproteobacteria bacterium]|nr:penicillin-binding protein 1C [Deltaproteobacteria bacterium]
MARPTETAIRAMSRLWIPALVATFALAVGGAVLADRLLPPDLTSLEPDGAVRLMDRQGRLLRFFLPADQQWRFPVRLQDVSPVLIHTLTVSEDRFFRRHPGINPLAVLRAAWLNLRSGRVVAGGSTITMQVARLTSPRPRTLVAKLHEATRALQLERRLTKDEILERYLNLTPYGGNIVGVGAAAHFYFGKAPDRLSLAESALLAVLPRSPTAYDPFKHPVAAKGARDRLLQGLAARGDLDPDEAARAMSVPLPSKPIPQPFRGPHFCQMVYDRLPDNVRKRGGVVTTTLDLDVQSAVERRLSARVDQLRREGLENVAAVVVDVASGHISAMAGSASFLDDAHHGQINAALVRRSPGSTLKPLLYGLAFEQGLLVPESILLDLPTDFSGYTVRNYDQRHRGRVTAAEALRESLNVPAVRLLARVGVDPFLDLLRTGGLTTLDRRSADYGLTLVLGSGEVRLMDLTDIYAALARSGLYLPAQYLPEPRNGPGIRLLSPESSHLVTEILADVRRSDLPQSWNLTRNAPAVAWKTGTSFGHRDAWAVGFSSRFAVGVWTGNLDGRPRMGISGARHAGPFLLDIFRVLEPEGVDLPSPQGLNIGRIEVCADSRELPNPACPRRMTINYLPGQTRLSPCKMHRRVFVDTETGYRLEGDCLGRRPHRTATVEDHDPELVSWWASRGMAAPVPPPVSPDCLTSAAKGEIRIVSPNARTPYRFRAEAPKEYQRVALRAQAPMDSDLLWWFMDGILAASGRPDEHLFLDLEPGTHRLVVQDVRGRTDSLSFRVE